MIQNRLLTKHLIHLLLLIVLLVTTFFHLWQLPHFPPPMTGDEAKNGLEVLLLRAEPKLISFAPANAGREAMFHYMLMLPMAIFGSTVFALRIIPTLAGIVAVALSYRWARTLLPPSPDGPWAALLTATCLSASLWALQLSRLGLRGILLLPCMLAAYHFFWLGYRRTQLKWFVFSGLFLGLAIHTYTASRALPLVFTLFVLGVTLFYRKREAGYVATAWRGLVITGLVSMLVFAPLGWYFLNNPGAFIFRSDQVSLQSIYQTYHAHTGQSFANFLLATWGEHLSWFIDLSMPWLQNRTWPLLLRGLPIFFFGLGIVRAVVLARRQAAYFFLLITFLVGILPIFIGLPTSMRVILAIPGTYALLAIGLYYPIDWSAKKAPHLRRPVSAAVTGAIVLVSSVSLIGLFQFERWVGPPPLTAPFDHALAAATERIRARVLDDKESVLVPQVIYHFPTGRYLLDDGFAFGPEPPADSAKAVLVFWPVDWARWFQNQAPSFVRLSPQAKEGLGVVDMAGQWDQPKITQFLEQVEAQRQLPDTETVVDATGQPVGHFIKLPEQLVFDSLRNDPQNPVRLDYPNGLQLLGYDSWFLSDRRVDVGLFWMAHRHILEDHHLVLQLIDGEGNVVGETVEPFWASPAYWDLRQPIISHTIIDLPAPPSPGIYTLKLGLIRDNYTTGALGLGAWSRPVNRAGAESLTPIGLIQVGDTPQFDHDLNVNFGDELALTGYRLEAGALPGVYEIGLRWQALQVMDSDYTITIQLLDQDNKLVAQTDKPPFGGAYPTTAWPPGTPLPDSYWLQLPENVPGGEYRLAVGVYDFDTLERLPVTQADSVIPGANLVVLQPVPVN